jgi:hypothetical protein
MMGGTGYVRKRKAINLTGDRPGRFNVGILSRLMWGAQKNGSTSAVL